MLDDSLLKPVDTDLFYTRNDPNDIRMGDVAFQYGEQYETANVVLIGCPQDEGVRRNKGRPGAAGAPEEIRRALYRYPIGAEHRHLKLCDLGNIKISGSLEDIHERLQSVVSRLIADKKTAVILGGGNDISYADCRALAETAGEVLAFNIDRHLDVRADDVRNSGTPYRMLLEEGWVLPGNFHEVGINSFANSEVYLAYVKEKGGHIHQLGDIRNAGVGLTIDSIIKESDACALFFGFDMDVVRAMEAPGVSDASPMGFTAREICEIADCAAADPRPKVIEITEVNPQYDVGGITAKLAANIIMRALAESKSS
ncbi:formimidoylglutamase [bacterium]|nr:formimidoylglutamase [bacterium]